MRDGLQEGFNILYGSGDSYSLAFSKLTEVVRKAEEDYTVEFIGGLNPKDDGKNKFFAIVMARLRTKLVPIPEASKPMTYADMTKAIDTAKSLQRDQEGKG